MTNEAAATIADAATRRKPVCIDPPTGVRTCKSGGANYKNQTVFVRTATGTLRPETVDIYQDQFGGNFEIGNPPSRFARFRAPRYGVAGLTCPTRPIGTEISAYTAR
jgi:hypothetical protein